LAGTETELPCDLVGVAIGQSKMHAIVEQFPGVTLDKRGCIVADPKTGLTGNPRVYSGGDCVNGGKERVNAVAEGRAPAGAEARAAARAMHAAWTKGAA